MLESHSKSKNWCTPEFKLKVIETYISGEGSLGALAHKYSVSALTTGTNRYDEYQSQGEEGLTSMMKPGKPRNQSTERKVSVELFFSSENPSLI